MLLDKFNKTVVNLVPHLIGGDGAKLAGGHFDGEIELAFVADVDDHRIRTAIAGKEVRDLLRSASA